MSITAIIIRAKNGHALTEACIASVRAHTDPARYFLVLVDDGSEPPLACDCDILVRTRTSEGAVTATNLGIAVALSRMCAYTMILDNDTTVPEGDIGWLDRFIAELEEHPDTACVGAVTNYANPPQHALTVPITYQSPWKDEQDGKVTREGIAENPPVPSFVSFAVLFRTAALQQIGQWDERYNPGNFEDTDYSVRVREAGMSIRVARSVYLHHEGHATFSEDLQRLLKVNGQKFFDKWGIGRLYDLGFVSPRQLAGALRASHAAN